MSCRFQIFGTFVENDLMCHGTYMGGCRTSGIS